MTLGSQNNNSTGLFPQVEAASSHGFNGAQTGQNFLNEDFLQVLDEHRKTCEKQGDVKQAQHARKRLKQLRI